MAESGPIRVCVLEGVYAHLPRLGFPLSVAAELCFDSAKWLTCQSGGGFSVTFFWPSLPGGRKATITNLIVSVIVGDVIVSQSPWSILVLVVILPPSLSQFQFLRHHHPHLMPTNLKKLWQLSCSLAKGFTAMLSENTTTTQLGKSSSEEDDSETEQSQLWCCGYIRIET